MSADIVDLVIIDGRPSVRGECDFATAELIGRWLATFDGDPLEIDLGDVTFFDAAALRVLLDVRQRNPHLCVVNASRAVIRVLELTNTVNYLINGHGSRRPNRTTQSP